MADPQLFRTDEGGALRFYERAEKNNFQSERHGIMLFDTVLYVEVITPGSTESVPEFACERTYCQEAGLEPKRTEYYKRYAKQIEAYKAQNGQYSLDGTPISAWPQIDTGTAATLKAAGVHTVEMLAAVSDSSLHSLGIGGRTLRDKAKQWIVAREFSIPTAQAGSEIAALRDRVAELEAENAALKARPAAASAPAPAEPAPAPAPSPAGTASVASAMGDAFAALSGSTASAGDLGAADPPPASALVI